MEGSIKAVKKKFCGGGRCRPPLASFLWIPFIISLAVSPVAQSQTSDFLIVERPDHLVVYDAFQQSVKSRSEDVFRPFTPFKILRLHDVLSDGLTRCSKVEVEGTVFYLLRNERGQLVDAKELGMVRQVQRAGTIDDTIEVLSSSGVAWESPDERSSMVLRAGDRCVRLFEFAGADYARRLDGRGDYGLLRLSKDEKGSAWRTIQEEPSRVTLSPMIRDRVIGRIREANLTYVDVYALLSDETRKRFPVPQWDITSTATSLTCVLRPKSAVAFYPQSIKALSSTLRTYLLGTGYDVFEQGDEIEIRRR